MTAARDEKLLAEHRKRAAALFAKYARGAKGHGHFATRPAAKDVLAADAATITSLLVLVTAKMSEPYDKKLFDATYELIRELPRHVTVATPADAVLLFALGGERGLGRYDDVNIKPALMVAAKVLKKTEDRSVRAAARELVPKITQYTKRDVAAKLRELAAIKRTPPKNALAANARAAAPRDLPAALTTPPWTQKKKIREPKLPKWWHANELPRVLLVKGAVLDDAAMSVLGKVLMLERLPEGDAAIVAARAAFEPRSLAVFAWELYAAWMDAGSEMKHAWALATLGYFGDDETATKLAPLANEWSVKYATRAGVALVALRRMAERGGDAALAALQSMTMSARTWRTKQLAKNALADLARKRGVDPEELAVPRFGLAADGSREMTFGSRKLRVTFDATLRPVLKDERGDVVALPKTRPDEWTALQRGVRKVASTQVLRLERAMRDRVTWPARVFEASFARHPLMMHAARGLVWRAASGATFRIAEDGTYADEKDRAFVLPAKAVVAVAHPIELAKESLDRWRALAEDYELVQPFPQIARPVFSLTPEERKSKTLTRWRGTATTVGRILGLERRGWARDAADFDDGDSIRFAVRVLRPSLVVSVALDPGLAVRMLSARPDQKLGEVTLGGKIGMKAKFGALTAIEASELVLDLESLAGG